MKTLKEYITEAVETYRLNSVKVTYSVQPEEIILQCPETYSESDIQIYMSDKWMNELPSYDDYARKFFGNNSDNIADVYFDYDSFEHLSVEPKEYIEWDEKYDSKLGNDVKLDYFKIKNLMYHIEFDRFDMIGVTDDNVKEKLVDIFKATESNNNNKYPIEIIFKEDSLEYRK